MILYTVRIACAEELTAGNRQTLGEIFTFGDGTFGVLGHGDEDSVHLPRMIDFLAQRNLGT